ncbi:hypothetical protein SAMN02745751_00681 [Dethiosulfatibacter aminovorans DSM 17477]|uniref:Uncharacterized protein n=1 Tax=Dethiosulfatibacter aminovorans DSM 17477 TaxID=1121476 RepID=A0A1M6CFJ2_9FIRM|nr:hypothetical protein [Dethiosulfatibacter aminovorans]SHI59468.1 hypothetical protein SAMN02745751_00681 [Dethiosulfatibacter aminovorans DSM 17477]
MNKDYSVKEVLQKKGKSTMFFTIAGFASILILNILITLTNKLGGYRNFVSIGLVVVFGIIIFLIVERIISVYVYMIADKHIAFVKRIGKKDNIILDVKFKEIDRVLPISEMKPNAEVNNTYYFIYSEADENCKFGEYRRDGKLYRFVFAPSERVMRILDRKVTTS